MMNAISKASSRQEPAKAILVEPTYYTVIDSKNPYMDQNTRIDHDQANEQWQQLLGAFKNVKKAGLLDHIEIMKGVEGLEDMVYCANQSLPWRSGDGEKHVIMSNMKHSSRKKEVRYFEQLYRTQGYKVHHISDDILLEGMGDCIPHPFKDLLWMGHGWRTSVEAAAEINRILNVKVMPLKLISAYFYHLDTCFLPVNDKLVMLCPDAFDKPSLRSIQDNFEEIVEVDKEEAKKTFCLNTTCFYHPENPVAVTQKGDHIVKRVLLENGYTVYEIETGEFMKGGGSVFCMKMLYY